MSLPFQFRTPAQRNRSIVDQMKRESERQEKLTQQEQQNLQREMQLEIRRQKILDKGDTFQDEFKVEQQRQQELDGREEFRGVERRQMAERRQRQDILDFREQQPPGLANLLSNVIRTGAQTAGLDLLGQELALPENLGGVTPPTVNLPLRQREPGFLEKALGVAGQAGRVVDFITDPSQIIGRAGESLQRPSVTGQPTLEQQRRQALFATTTERLAPPSFTEIQEEGATVSRPLVRPVLQTAADVVQEVEKPLGIEGVVSDKLRSQLAEDIATEILNPINIALAAPFAMQGTAGMTGVRLATQIASNLTLTGLEPGGVRAVMRGLSLLGRASISGPRAVAAALRTLPKVVRESDTIRQALKAIREGEAGARPLRGGEDIPLRLPDELDSPTGLGPPAEPDPPRLPTIREVEARSAKIPPHVRAELAGDVPSTAIPLEDFGTVQVRWGERFQQNIVTKVEDMLGGRIPGIAKPTPESRAVRRAMVQADLYRVTQKARARSQVYEWAGRNRETLGLDGNGKVKALQVAEGADIPGGRKFFGLADDSLTQRLDHVIEHPEKYVINPEQRRALDELDDILDQVLRTEQRAGVDVMEIAGDYFPRVLVRRPVDDPRGIKLAGRLGTRPGHAKSRFFGDIEKAWELGYRYDTPMSALFNRVESAADAIANINAVRVVKSLGQKPSARVSQELVDAARAAREEFKAARKLASRRGATKADKLRLQEAEVALDNHKKALRIAAQQAKDVQPKVFGRIVSPEVAEEFSRYIGKDLAEGPLDQALQMARANMIWGDHSAGLVQFWTLFWRDNPTWWKAMGHGIIANLREPWGFVARNADVIGRGTSTGAITPPSEFLLRSGGKFSRAFGNLPLVKQTQRMFEWTIFTGQTMRWKAMEQMAKNADDLMELAAVSRATSGTAITPGLTRAQAKALGRTFFAGRFLIATTSVLKNALKGGAAGVEARKILGLAFGGAFTTMVGGHMALNNGKLPNLTDPDKAGFFSMRVGDTWVQPFGPFHPFIVATFRTGRAIKDITEGKTPNSRDLQAWPRFLEGKGSLGVRINLQIMDALGIPLSEIRGEPFQRLKLATGEDWLRQIQEYLPIGPSEAVEAIARKGTGGLAGLSEIIGGRTSVVTPFQELSEGFKEEFGRDFDPQSSADWTLARQNSVTAPLVEAVSARSLSRGTEGALRAEETEQKQAAIEQNLELPRDAAEFRDGNLKLGDDLIRKYRDLQTQMAGVLIQVDKPEGEAATEDDRILREIQALNPNAAKYRDSETGDTDWGAFFTDVEVLKEQLTPEVRQAYADILRGVNEDWRRVEPQVKNAIALRRELFEIPKYLDPNKSDAEELEYESRLKEFMNFVREEMDKAKREFGPDFSLTLPEAARILGKRDFNDEQLGQDAAAIFSNKVKLNPDRETFLDEHQEELVPFFPDLYRRKSLQGLLSDELFEVAIAR